MGQGKEVSKKQTIQNAEEEYVLSSSGHTWPGRAFSQLSDLSFLNPVVLKSCTSDRVRQGITILY